MLKPRMTVLLSSCLLAACSSVPYQQARNAIDSEGAQADQLNTMAQQPLPKADTSRVQLHRGVYLGASVLKRQSGQTLPPSVEHDGVRLVTAAPVGLLEIGDLITEATGIPVAFAADVFGESLKSKNSTSNANGAPSAAPTQDSSLLPQPSPAAGDLAAALDAALPHAVRAGKSGAPALFAGKLDGSSRARMRVNYKGPLSGFLNLAASYFDIGWTYRDGRLQFSRNITRTFQIAAMPTTMTSTASMSAGLTGGSSGGGGDSGGGGGSSGGSSSGGSSGGGSGGGSGASNGGTLSAGANQNATVSMSVDVWKDLDNSLKTIVGDEGKYSTSKSDSMISVTGPASVVERVGRYVHDLNKQLLRQVTVKVAVYNVSLSQNSDWQFSLAGMFKNAAGNTFGFGGGGVAKGAASISSNVLSGPYKDSHAVLSLLGQQGDVSVVTTTAVTTMSGQPVPVQVSRTQNYLASVTMSVTDKGLPIYTPNISSVNSGFSINVLPKVMDDGKVLLQYSMNVSALTKMEQVSMQGNSVSMPTVDQRSFIQSGLINNGSTLVVAGYEQANSESDDDGMGSPHFKLLGGGQQGLKKREVLVICITPVVLDNSAELARMN